MKASRITLKINVIVNGFLVPYQVWMRAAIWNKIVRAIYAVNTTAKTTR